MESPQLSRVRVLGRERDDDSDELANAEVVIGVGVGVTPDDYPLLRSLAEQIDATLCATRKVTDKGWMPRARQVGITGHSISPRLFISLGASGKFNHTVGIRSAGTVMAATPGLPSGSSAAPARTSRRRLTAGCSSCDTATTCSPFASVFTA